MLLAKQHSEVDQFQEWPDFSNDNRIKRRTVKKPFQSKAFIRVLVGVLCLIIANIIFQALVIKRTQEIKVWQAKLTKLERYSTKLRIEMANLESFERIQTAAQRDLGMRIPGPDDYLCIAANRNLTRTGRNPIRHIPLR